MHTKQSMGLSNGIKLGSVEFPEAGATPWYQAGGVSASDIAAIWSPEGAASLAASYLRIAGDQGNANIDPAVVGGIAPGSWDTVNGWRSAGYTTYLKTGVIEANTDWTFMVKFSGATEGIAMGWTNGGQSSWIYPVNTTNRTYVHGGTNTVAGQQAAGVMCVAGSNCYLNGVADGTITQAAITAVEFYLFARNNGGAAATHFNLGYIQKVAIYKTTLTAPQVVAISNAIFP